MATDWWVLVPIAEKNIQTRPPDSIVYSLQQGSAIDNSWAANNQSPSVTVNGKQYVPLIGPFKSQSDAQSAQVSSGTPGIGPGIIGGLLTPGNPVQGAENPPSLSNPLAALAGIARGLADFVGTVEHVWKVLTNWRMWASLGWLVVGLIVLLAGIAYYLTGDINPVSAAKLLM